MKSHLPSLSLSFLFISQVSSSLQVFMTNTEVPQNSCDFGLSRVGSFQFPTSLIVSKSITFTNSKRVIPMSPSWSSCYSPRPYPKGFLWAYLRDCLLYTSDAADDYLEV